MSFFVSIHSHEIANRKAIRIINKELRQVYFGRHIIGQPYNHNVSKMGLEQR